MPHPLDALLRPRSVAVVGASRKRGTIAAEIFHNLLRTGYTGAVYPVNPHTPVVQAVRAWPSVQSIPDPVDLAVIVVPATAVLEAVEDCGKKGVKGIVVITAGFGEMPGEGVARQELLKDRLRHYGMRMVGPNCLGLLNADPEISLDATFAPTFPPFGSVAFSSQSGALGLAILDHARQLGVGISQFVSMGNQADVTAAELIEYWEQDAATRVILLYMENLGDPRRFMEVARRVSRSKPIAVVKSGRTAAGARAASSHTGSLAGADVAVDALLGQAGIIRTDTIDELFDVAMLLANQPVPHGPRVAVLTNAGGPGIMATDACESRGLHIATLSPETEAALRLFLPAEASVRNPVDMIASASAASYEAALRLLLADPAVDAVLVIFVTPIVTDAHDVASAIRSAATGHQKTVVTCLMGTHGVPAALSSLREGRFPSYAFPEAAARALARATGYGAWLARPEGTLPVVQVDQVRARAALGSGPPRWLSPQATAELLGAFGIRTPRSVLATTAEDAARAAVSIGGKLAVKLHSSTITHKSDVGGVILGVEGPEAVAGAFASIAWRLESRGLRGEMEGVLVQELLPPGVELLVGATLDPSYGHLVAFGAGGVNVELWKDLVFRVAPLRDLDVEDMIQGIKARALLEGFRGAPPVDKNALVRLILAVSRMVESFPEIQELDLNPVLALPDGVVAVDARVRLR